MKPGHEETRLAAPAAHAIANILTFDVEDWYHLSGQQMRGAGTLRPEILARQLDEVLGLLAHYECRATFFCLGSSLVDAPHLVHRIAAAGHEIGSHGWAHQPLARIGLTAFRADLQRSVAWLEDLLGRAVLGFRAPAFSVTAAQLDAFYDVCCEAGLRYDSSVFPIRGRRYGIPGALREPHVVRTHGTRPLVEVPLATLTWLGRTWPVAGGGYWRVLPASVIRAAVQRLNRAGRPMVTYLHPYEFDPCYLSGAVAAGRSLRSLAHTLKQNLNRRTVRRKLAWILAAHRFGAVEDYLRETERL
jgi:polysaccharide deacetylase family protein (PEP-CTERM system associated)